jgi:hypothetical protein
VHLRFTDRTGPNGEKILHVEEIQSDWGQKGKKEGFRNPDDNMQDLVKEYDYLTKQRRALEVSVRNGDDAAPATQAAVSRLTEVNNQMQALSDRMTAVRSNIPTAPYVTNTQAWTDLALKRALKEAAEGGYDKLVWTPGAEQAKRYGLSKQKGMKGYYDEIVPNQLSKLVKKLDPEAKIGAHDIVTREGGKSADAAALGNRNDLIEQGRFWDDQAGEYTRGYRVSAPDGSEIGIFEDLPDAHAALENHLGNVMEPNQVTRLHSLEITPKMRESILKGQTAFKDGGSVVDRALMLISKQA